MPLILDHSDTVNDLILFVVTVTYILWSSGFALYLWVYIINMFHTLGIWSVSHCK